MTPFPAMFPRLSADWEKLFALAEPQLDAFLKSLLSGCEDGPDPIDFDRLIGLGVRLARAGREKKDEVAIDWLAERPIARRLDIVAGFLGGLWQRPYRTQPVQPAPVERFISLRNSTLLDDDAAYSSVLALIEILRSDAPESLRKHVAQVLEAASQESYRHPVIAMSARKAIAAALEHRP